jgi:ribosomal protein S20
MKQENTTAQKNKRKKSDVITFEKHYGEPLTETEQDEIADLIASIVFDSLMETATDKPTPTL